MGGVFSNIFAFTNRTIHGERGCFNDSPKYKYKKWKAGFIKFFSLVKDLTRVKVSSVKLRITHVAVEIPDMERQRKTNGTGLYVFKQARPGVYTVVSKARGYESK